LEETTTRVPPPQRSLAAPVRHRRGDLVVSHRVDVPARSLRLIPGFGRFGRLDGRWPMTDGRWPMTDDRRVPDDWSLAIGHWSSVIDRGPARSGRGRPGFDRAFVFDQPAGPAAQLVQSVPNSA